MPQSLDNDEHKYIWDIIYNSNSYVSQKGQRLYQGHLQHVQSFNHNEKMKYRNHPQTVGHTHATDL